MAHLRPPISISIPSAACPAGGTFQASGNVRSSSIRSSCGVASVPLWGAAEYAERNCPSGEIPMRKYEIQRRVVLYTVVWADSQEEAVARAEAIPLSGWHSSPEPNGQMVLRLNDDPVLGTVPLTPHW